MKAAILSGPDSEPVVADRDEPPADPRNGVLTMVAAGLHPVVRTMASGRHYASGGAWPLVPGIDGVARFGDGSLAYVAGPHPPHGTFAEQVSPSLVIALPDDADVTQVAAGTNPAMSSWLPLEQRRRDLGAEGSDGAGLGTVLVLGATGVAGRIAVQNAFLMGADHVIAAGRDAAVLADQAGPDRSLVALTGDADQDREALTEAAAAHRPSTVLDYVWGAPAELAFAALAGAPSKGGVPTVYVQVGDSAGADATLPAALLRSTPISIRGSGAGAAPMQEVLVGIREVTARLADGSLVVPVDTFPLTDVSAAWHAPRQEGRVVITMQSVDRPTT